VLGDNPVFDDFGENPPLQPPPMRLSSVWAPTVPFTTPGVSVPTASVVEVTARLVDTAEDVDLAALLMAVADYPDGSLSLNISKKGL
jgi:hypothetical protein